MLRALYESAVLTRVSRVVAVAKKRVFELSHFRNREEIDLDCVTDTKEALCFSRIESPGT